MKNLLTILSILIFGFINSQSLKPIIGLKFTGGVSYQMDHEYFGGVVGVQYTPQNENFAFADVTLSGEYVYDYLQKFTGEHNFYVLRLQGAKPVNEWMSFTYYGGYMNLLSTTTEKNFAKLKTNITWGAGIRLHSDELYAEALYENLGGYPHISVCVVFPLLFLLRK